MADRPLPIISRGRTKNGRSDAARGRPEHGSPRMTLVRRVGYASVAVVGAATVWATSVRAAVRPERPTPSPPKVLFANGYDLCKVAPLAAIEKAGGQHYNPGKFFFGV